LGADYCSLIHHFLFFFFFYSPPSFISSSPLFPSRRFQTQVSVQPSQSSKSTHKPTPQTIVLDLSSSRSSTVRSSVSDFEEGEFRFASESVSEVERVSIVVDLVAWCLWLWVFGVRIGAQFLGGCGF
jgi:hypothetical protein